MRINEVLSERRVAPLDPSKMMKWLEKTFQQTHGYSDDDMRKTHLGFMSQINSERHIEKVDGKFKSYPEEHGRYITDISMEFAEWIKQNEQEMRKRGWHISIIEDKGTMLRGGRDVPMATFRMEPFRAITYRKDSETLYHVSPAEYRASIERKGLTPRKSDRDMGYDTKVFLAVDRESAEKIARLLKKNDEKRGVNDRAYDMWEVDRSLLRKGTKFFKDMEFESEGVWTYSHIPSEAVKHVGEIN